MVGVLMPKVVYWLEPEIRLVRAHHERVEKLLEISRRK
jgi:hypothetical protein